MAGFFYNLGKSFGPGIRRGRWLWNSLTDGEDSVQLEREVGRDLANQVKRELKLDSDPKIAAMLDSNGARLAERLTNENYRFSFQTLEQRVPNAFALPGGFIFANRSLIELCQHNTDEIAFILGHEMGHVVRGHAVNRIITNSAVAAAVSAASIRGLAGGFVQKVGVQFLQSAYSQELELEADELAARLIMAAGYNRDAPFMLLSRLSQLSRDSSQMNLGQYFSSHPSFDRRIENLRRLIKK